MGITKLAKLQRHLDAVLDTARNAASTLQAVRYERDQARKEAEDAGNSEKNIRAQVALQRTHVRRLFASIFHLNLELARKNGYIDRVRETDEDRSIAGPASDEISPEQVDAAREYLAGARSDKMVARVIDGMDTDVLDQVLGRTNDADYERG